MEQEISDMGVGSTFAAICKSDMGKIKIPLASTNHQKEFSDFVQQVDKSKAIVQKCIDKYDQLVKSRFIEMFGNPTKNEKQWPTEKMKEVAPAIQSDIQQSLKKIGCSIWMLFNRIRVRFCLRIESLKQN